MANVLLSTLLPLMRLRSCPDNTMLQELRIAHRKFCYETEVWEEYLADILSVEDQVDYDLTSAHVNTFIRRVTEVYIGDVLQEETLWSLSNAKVLTLDAAPHDEDTVIKVRVIYIPTELNINAIDWISEEYGMAIAKGAEARLKEDPVSNEHPVPWYDAPGAITADQKFSDGVVAAKANRLENRQSGHMAAFIPSFYR